MLAASAPLGFAQSASSESASSTPASSAAASSAAVSSSTSSHEPGNEWMRPCDNLTGLKKAQCIVKHNPGKGHKKDRVERRTDDKALRITTDCKDKEGSDLVKCVRMNGKKGIKTVRQNLKSIIRTIRGKTLERSEN